MEYEYQKKYLSVEHIHFNFHFNEIPFEIHELRFNKRKIYLQRKRDG